MARRPTSEPAEIDYEKAAQDYLKQLPLTHFMEAKPQARQRAIFLASLDLVSARRRDVHAFNEMLVQWPWKKKPAGKSDPGQVVPDNMVVITDQPITAIGSYDVPRQPAPPFWVLEYVSKKSERKDYETNFEWYERELAVPYYLVFYPDIQELNLYRHNGKRYLSVVPDSEGRAALPELQMEVGLVAGWTRFWFRGELLPLPAQLQKDLNKARRQLKKIERERDSAQKERDSAQKERDSAQKERDSAVQQLTEQAQRAEELQRQLDLLRAQLGQPPQRRNGS